MLATGGPIALLSQARPGGHYVWLGLANQVGTLTTEVRRYG